MAKRIGREQKAHDRKVREIARQSRKQGSEVRAAGVRGYQHPHPIGKEKKIPDIEIKTGRSRRIIEVKTPKSLITDKEQLKTFTRHAAHKKGTKFDVVVTKPRKRK